MVTHNQTNIQRCAVLPASTALVWTFLRDLSHMANGRKQMVYRSLAKCYARFADSTPDIQCRQCDCLR